MLPKNEDKIRVSLGFSFHSLGWKCFLNAFFVLLFPPNLPVTVYNDDFPQIIIACGGENKWLKDQPKRICSICSQYPGKESNHLGMAVFEINNGSGVFFFHRVRSLLQMVLPLRQTHLGHPKKVMVCFFPSFVWISWGCPGQGVREYKHNCKVYLFKWAFSRLSSVFCK